MDKVRVAIVGCGNVSQVNVPGYLKHPQCEVYALCDSVRERAERRAQQWSITPKIYTNYAEVLSDPHIDAIELLTPTTLHGTQAVAALDAGKHVSCQKPISVTIAEADAIVAAASRAKAKFRVTENFIYYPPLVKAKELLDSGAIGEPSLFRCHTTKVGKVQSSVITMDPEVDNWRRSPTINPSKLQWRMYDHAVHEYAVAMYLLGDIDSVYGNVNQNRDMMEIPSAALWKFKDGNCLGMADYSHAPGMTIRGKYFPVDEFFEIHGTKGTIWVTRCSSEMLDLPPVVLLKGLETVSFQPPMDWIESFNGAANDFIQGIIQDKQPDMDARSSRKALQVAVGVYEASRTKRAVAVDSVTQGSLGQE